MSFAENIQVILDLSNLKAKTLIGVCFGFTCALFLSWNLKTEYMDILVIFFASALTAVLTWLVIGFCDWAWGKWKIPHHFEYLDRTERELLREFFILGKGVLTFPSDEDVVSSLERKRIIYPLYPEFQRGGFERCRIYRLDPRAKKHLTPEILLVSDGVTVDQNGKWKTGSSLPFVHHRPKFMDVLYSHYLEFDWNWK